MARPINRSSGGDEHEQRMRLANAGERIEAEGLEMEYLPDEDYLRLTIGWPRESISLTRDEAAYVSVMVDPATYKITGIEVPFFKESMERLRTKGNLSEFWMLVEQWLSSRQAVSV